MIEPAEIHLTNDHVVQAERARIKDNGWVAANPGDGWDYYPPHAVNRVSSLKQD